MLFQVWENGAERQDEETDEVEDEADEAEDEAEEEEGDEMFPNGADPAWRSSN